MKICTKCQEPTKTIYHEGDLVDVCIYCGLTETEETDNDLNNDLSNDIELFNPLPEIFESFAGIFGGQKN